MEKNINLKEMPTVTCESCGFDQFKEITYIKRVPKELTGADRDTDVPFPTYACIKCGHVNDDFNPFFEGNADLEL
jgi:predicted nucleic-acid-binding Zn-ribbon protein